jgi:hypothetical protein
MERMRGVPGARCWTSATRCGPIFLRSSRRSPAASLTRAGRAARCALRPPKRTSRRHVRRRAQCRRSPAPRYVDDRHHRRSASPILRRPRAQAHCGRTRQRDGKDTGFHAQPSEVARHNPLSACGTLVLCHWTAIFSAIATSRISHLLAALGSQTHRFWPWRSAVLESRLPAWSLARTTK